MQVRCAGNTRDEQAVQEELLGLLNHYNLTPWQCTETVVIEKGAIPHSHPVLTLGTFNRGRFLLASYLHEQLHWFLVPQMAVVEPIYGSELLDRFPTVPVGLPEGAHDAESTYLHLFVCWYEVEALRHLLGPSEAQDLVALIIEHGVYRWVYRTVVERYDELGQLYAHGGVISPLAVGRR